MLLEPEVEARTSLGFVEVRTNNVVGNRAVDRLDKV